MKYHVICCNKYYLVAATNDRDEALRVCRLHEDGTFVSIIQRDGRIVGDSVDGWTDNQPAEYCVDAATRTGMYDAW